MDAVEDAMRRLLCKHSQAFGMGFAHRACGDRFKNRCP